MKLNDIVAYLVLRQGIGKKPMSLALLRRADPVRALDKALSRSIIRAQKGHLPELTILDGNSITVLVARAVLSALRFAKQSRGFIQRP